MYAQLSYSEVLRDAETVLVTQDVALGRPVDQEAPGLCFVLTVAGRTGGTVTAQALGAVSGGAYFSLGSSMDAALSTDGIYYIPIDGSVPPRLGVRLTPAGGFDGTVSIVTRAGGRIGTSIPGQD